MLLVETVRVLEGILDIGLTIKELKVRQGLTQVPSDRFHFQVLATK